MSMYEIFMSHSILALYIKDIEPLSINRSIHVAFISHKSNQKIATINDKRD